MSEGMGERKADAERRSGKVWFEVLEAKQQKVRLRARHPLATAQTALR